MITLHESLPTRLMSDVLDLALARACALCDVPGRSLCLTCLEDIRRVPAPLNLSPVHPGRYALPYRAGGSKILLEYKEEGNRSLASGLALFLADAVEALLEHDLPRTHPAPVTLVPIPGHTRSDRGFDALDRVVRSAVRLLRASGVATCTRPLLRRTLRHGPLKSMTRHERRHAVPGSITAPSQGRPPTGPVIVVDDVITTGSTIREALRALDAGGLPVSGFAAIAHAEAP